MFFFLIVLAALFIDVRLYDLCGVKENGECSDKYPCVVKSMNFGSRDCTEVTFTENERIANELGAITLQVYLNQSSSMVLNISFTNVSWKRAYLRISDDANLNQNVCKMYTIEKRLHGLNSDLYDTCFWITGQKLRAKTYFLEYKAENKLETMYKKILFDLPDSKFFNDSLPLSKRLIFSYIDFTRDDEILLKIQALPRAYNVSLYKVEVFREKDQRTLLLDVGQLSAYRRTVLNFEYLTYNEEGHYYFGISAISDKCLENSCVKTFTSKVYVGKKGTSLVIGIVGASFIIPFVLFIFHMWNRKFKNSGGFAEPIEKILILFKPSTERHNDVVATLAKTIKNLTGIEVMLDPVNPPKSKRQSDEEEQWLSDNLILATHIMYVAPPRSDDEDCVLDSVTHTFLKGETRKSVPDKQILVLNLPYSTGEVPPVMVKCPKFELMTDFHKLLNVFQPLAPDFNYENNMNCMELMKKMGLAQAETDAIRDDCPRIVVTISDDHV